METCGSDAAVTHPGRAEDRDYEPEHLPPLLEDEENVSLADILSLRDSCLTEDEVWAVCAECALALQSIRPSHLFHTLCITPDTLAFNAHGNVCFMEQLSDDPEGSFVPPEFDSTGSTFEGHVYSLGSTLSAALSFVIEPELEAELGDEIQRLLEQMQEEKPEDRPLIQDILCLAEARLSHTSSAAVCRKLSSVGRRVLSIESVSAFQDGQESSWEARWQHPKPRCLLKRLSSDDNSKELCADSSVKANGLSRQQVCAGWDSSLWEEDMDSGDGDGMILAEDLDCRSHNSSPVRRRAQQRLTRVRGALNRSCSVPDSNNPPCLSPPSHGDISVPVSDLTEIGADEHLSCKSVWSNRLQRLNRGRSCESYPHSSAEDYVNSAVNYQVSEGNEDAPETLFSGETKIQGSHKCESCNCARDSASSCTFCQELEMEQDSSWDRGSLNHSLYIPNNYMTKSMLCLNEESQDEVRVLREQWIRAKYERKEFSEPGKNFTYEEGTRDGMLMKRGRDNGQFLSRRFVLSEREGTLKYFTKYDAKEPKAVIKVDTMNATFQPEKIGNPNGLQITYLKDYSTRNMFVYHDSGKEIVDWLNSIRAVQLHYLKVAFPGATDAELLPRLTRNFLKEGYMEKTGPRQTEGFKKRWFTLDHRRLMYFKDPLDAFAKGEVFLGNKDHGYNAYPGLPATAHCNGAWQHGITIETPDRCFLFTCETESDQQDWLKHFTDVMSATMSPQEYTMEALFKHRP